MFAYVEVNVPQRPHLLLINLPLYTEGEKTTQRVQLEAILRLNVQCHELTFPHMIIPFSACVTIRSYVVLHLFNEDVIFDQAKSFILYIV